MTTTAARNERSTTKDRYVSVLDCLHDFDVEFPTEQSAKVHVLEKLVCEVGVECRTCGTSSSPDSHDARHFPCSTCNRPIWTSAGTFFADVRNFRPWLAMIFLMEHGVAFTPSQFSSIIGVSTSTAAEMKRKLDDVILSEIPGDAPAVPSSLLPGCSVGGRLRRPLGSIREKNN